jgi:hypothetical protein
MKNSDFGEFVLTCRVPPLNVAARIFMNAPFFLVSNIFSATEESTRRKTPKCLGLNRRAPLSE